jgi:flagellin-like protein
MGDGSMRKLFRSRKALSPVLSTVLMILVTIIGMSVLFAFFVNYARDFQLGSGSAVRESLVIEDVGFIKGTNQVEVWVYNVGKVDLKIAAFYIDDSWASIDSGSDVAISVGEHGMLTVSSDFVLNGVYDFKIVTERGSAFEGRYAWQA